MCVCTYVFVYLQNQRGLCTEGLSEGGFWVPVDTYNELLCVNLHVKFKIEYKFSFFMLMASLLSWGMVKKELDLQFLVSKLYV
jgi:hypothetical protein